jgi:hypothetical protein
LFRDDPSATLPPDGSAATGYSSVK